MQAQNFLISKDFIFNENRNKFKLACKKQNLEFKKLIDFINVEREKILVVGDSILDQFAG